MSRFVEWRASIRMVRMATGAILVAGLGAAPAETSGAISGLGKEHFS